MKPLKIGAYIRVSTEDQVKVYEGSLDSQRHQIDRFVEFKNQQQKDWGHVVEYYVEEGVSAGTTNRPMYQKIMADVRNGKVNLILVSDLTRLSRNLLDFCNLINELEENKASYLSMKEQFDTSTPIGRMIVYIIIALGQFEREQTSERVSVNCHSRALRGLMNGGPAPYGYERNVEKPGLLEVNPKEAEIVRTIFETFIDCGSRSKTVEKLRELGIKPKRINRRTRDREHANWTIKTIGNLLQDPLYIGYKEVNKIYKDEDPSDLKPWQRYQLVKSASPSILAEATFNDAQKLLDEAKEKERARNGKSERRNFMLTGLVDCGEAGLPLVGQAGHSKLGTVYRYYHYARRPAGLAFVRPRLSADELEEKLMTELRSSLKTAGYFDEIEKAIIAQQKKESSGIEAEKSRAKQELAELSERINTIWTNQARMKLNEEALQETSNQLNSLSKKKADLEKYLKGLESKTYVENSAKSQVLFIENQIRELLRGWAKASVAKRKRLLRRTIKRIIVTRTEMKIEFWKCLEDQMGVQGTDPSADKTDGENIIKFRRRSPRSEDHNLSIEGSGKVSNGSGRGT